MNHIRALVQTPSVLHRLLLTFATAFLVIVGLLAMHTLAGNLTVGHADTAVTAVGNVADPMTDAVATADSRDPVVGMSSETSAGHCVGDCSGSDGMPDHSMLMMACILALLGAMIVLLAPALLIRFGYALSPLRLYGRSLLAALPHPRPPSLIVLSISRT